MAPYHVGYFIGILEGHSLQFMSDGRCVDMSVVEQREGPTSLRLAEVRTAFSGRWRQGYGSSAHARAMMSYIKLSAEDSSPPY
jgi:hypothetical protein